MNPFDRTSRPRDGRLVTVTPSGGSKAAAFQWHGRAGSHHEARDIAMACFEMVWQAMTAARGHAGLAMPEAWCEFQVVPEYHLPTRESWTACTRMLNALPPMTGERPEIHRWPGRVLAAQRSLRTGLDRGQTATIMAEAVTPRVPHRERAWIVLRHPGGAALKPAYERALLLACMVEVAVLGPRRFGALETESMAPSPSATMAASEKLKAGGYAERLMRPVATALRAWGIESLAAQVEAEARRDTAEAHGGTA